MICAKRNPLWFAAVFPVGFLNPSQSYNILQNWEEFLRQTH